MEREFDMRVSHLRKVFWEVEEKFIEVMGDLLSLQPDLMRKWSVLYASGVRNFSGPLNRCTGSLDCTRINMCCLGGPNFSQQACYSGNKHIHCLMYMTIHEPDILIFAMHGPQESRTHYMTLLGRSELEKELDEILNIDVDQYYVYGNSSFTILIYLYICKSHSHL